MDRKRENVEQVAVLNVNMLFRCQSHVQWGEFPNTRQLAGLSDDSQFLLQHSDGSVKQPESTDLFYIKCSGF